MEIQILIDSYLLKQGYHYHVDYERGIITFQPGWIHKLITRPDLSQHSLLVRPEHLPGKDTEDDKVNY